MSDTINWTPDLLHTSNGYPVEARDGTRMIIHHYSGGWTIGPYERLDIWSALRVLNDAEATRVQPEPGHASDCPMSDMLYVTRGYDIAGDRTRCKCGKTPPEPEPAKPAEPEKVTADRGFDPISRFTWLDFGQRVDETLYKALLAAGWRYSGYRKMFYTNRRFPTIPAGVEAQDIGEVTFAEERAERLRDRADRTQTEAQTRWDTAGKIADMIPFGQPILVGHHSEGRHRRDLQRIAVNTDKALDGFKAAQTLTQRADSSEAHQAWKRTPGVIQRRIERLSAEERKLTRDRAQWGSQEIWQERYNAVLKELAEAQAELTALGGIPADAMDLRPGMVVLCDGALVEITRVNKKTISGVVAEGGAKGWRMKWDKSHIKQVVRNADGTLPAAAAATQEVTR